MVPLLISLVNINCTDEVDIQVKKYRTNAVNLLEYVLLTYYSDSFSKLRLYPRYYKELIKKSLKLNKSVEVTIFSYMMSLLDVTLYKVFDKRYS